MFCFLKFSFIFNYIIFKLRINKRNVSLKLLIFQVKLNIFKNKKSNLVTRKKLIYHKIYTNFVQPQQEVDYDHEK